MTNNTTWTGERLETFIFNETTIEHLHRYAIAMELAKGKTVLDIACGEGYGTNLLSAVAIQVTGMDIDTVTIEKAKVKYKKINTSFEAANAEKIPCPDQSFDLVVSFETLEHVNDQLKMISECKRVLRPGGILLISTPDKKNYSDKTGYKNPFHTKELYREEFEQLVKTSFKETAIIEQLITHASFIKRKEQKETDIYTGNFDNIEKNKPAEPLYFIALASDNKLPALNNSFFAGNSIVQQALAEKEKMVTSTITYRLGHFLLYPFKLIRNIFKK